MALTTEQRDILLNAKARGLSKQQGMALAFKQTPNQPQGGRFSDAGEDVSSAFKGAGSDLKQRYSNIGQSFLASEQGKQTPIETGAQFAGNVLGAGGDLAFRAAQGVVTPFMKESEERAVQSGVEKVFEPVAEKIAEQSPRTQRNITGALGLFEGVTAGLGTAATKPVTSTVGRLINKFKGGADNVPTPQVAKRTPEQVFQQADEGLRRQANDPNLSPTEQEAAANSALTFKERYIGLTPDVKARLAEMGPDKLQEYLDVTHLRNISDKNPGPYEVGANNVRAAEEQLTKVLNETGSGIGQTRQKLGTFKMSQPQVQNIDRIFKGELERLGLTIRNGQVVQKANAISPAGSGDINALNNLLQDVNTFKQSPTLANAIDLRKNFDAKIKFGKSARDISNEVDPLSRAVRSTIAKEAGRTVGTENAALVTQYSDFMDAYGDLRSFTNRAAGGEYLLRLVLSGRGGEARKLIDTIKEYTGVDLMNDATAMKVANQTLGNENTQNLFRQEVTNAGYDAASVITGSPTGIASVLGKRLLDMGISAEDVLKAAAAGTGGYMLMAYSDEQGIMLPAGLAVLSAMPAGSRNKAIKQATDAGKKLKLSPADKRIVAEALEGYDTAPMTVKVSGKENIADSSPDVDMRLQQLKDKNASGTFTDADALEAHSLLEDRGALGESSFGKSATTQTTLLEEAKKFKTADEFVRKPRGNEDTLYHYTNANVGDTLKPRPNVELAEMNYLGDGVYVTNQKNGYEGKNELMAFPSKDLDILDLTTAVAEEKFLEQISKEIGTPVARSGGGLYDDLRLMASNIGENHQRVKDAVSKVSKGKDGIKANFAQYTNDDNFYELVLNEKVDVKTKAQLTDIWKQANQ